MKILQINTVYGIGSTGKIAKEIHDVCVRQNKECLTGYRDDAFPHFPFEDTLIISGPLDSRIHGVLARYTLLKGFFSIHKTLRFISKAKKYAPDIIHLHNLHGSYINIPILFHYIRNKHIPVVWTLHDCWPFTAICSHFTIADCSRWISGCGHCPQLRACSSAKLDITSYVWRWKKRNFLKPENMVIITPSQWLASLVKQSFLKQYPVRVINNGIDLSVFKPTPSDFRNKHNISNEKYLILGVAFDWGLRKGLDIFVELAAQLDPQQYQIVLVGTNDVIDHQLPSQIITIHHTQNQYELAKIYSAASVFVNPTREDNFPTVNLEALACGTPVITFRTGGSPECLDDSCGMVVNDNSVLELKQRITQVCEQRLYTAENCINRAVVFNKDLKIQEYIQLYERLYKAATDAQHV